MRLSWLTITCLAVSPSSTHVGAQQTLRFRQESDPSLVTSPTISSIPQTTLDVSTEISPKASLSLTEDRAGLPSNASATTKIPPTSFLTKSAALPTNSANVNDTTLGQIDDPLPLPPTITPALAIAGVLLMSSGAIYAMIGIKNQWVQIFISTVYLIALSISVRMYNLPVSLYMEPITWNLAQRILFSDEIEPLILYSDIICNDTTDQRCNSRCIPRWGRRTRSWYSRRCSRI